MVVKNCFNIEKIECGLLIGAGHGIGLALVEEVNQISPTAKLWATYRREDKARGLLEFARSRSNIVPICLDPSEEEQLVSLKNDISGSSRSLDLLINTVGVLHDEELKPEKSVRQCNLDKLMRYFKINACISPLLAKVFMDQLRASNQSAFVTISAKVGSITDNKMGGWYGYRASKAALNMFTKTIALEFEGRKMNTIALAIHPGTTRTDLSEPYIAKTKLKVHSPGESAENIVSLIDGKSRADTGTFWSWDGTQLEW